MESWADGFQEYRHWATGGFLRLTRFRSSEKVIPILLADGLAAAESVRTSGRVGSVHTTRQ